MNLFNALVDAHVSAGRGDRPAIVAGGNRLTYAALGDRVRRLAAGLRAESVGPGDRVLIAVHGAPDAVAAWLAVQYVGGIAVMVPPTLRRRELEAIVADAAPRLAIVTPASAVETLPATSVAALDARGSGLVNPHHCRDDDVCVIAYTSGADGRPLGACHTGAAVLASAECYAGGVLGLTADDVVGGHPPLAFAYGLGALLVFPLRVGAASTPAAGFDVETLLGTIARERVTVFFGTATAYRLLLRAPELLARFDLSSLRLCVSAGEPLPAEISAAWRSHNGVDLLDGLGTTELFHMVVSQRPGAVVHGALGRPVPGYELRVVDDQMRGVEPGTPGALAVRGPTGGRYWRREDVQRVRVRDGWTLTGDVVTQDQAGLFWFGRRADGIIVSAGYNVAPREVEIVLQEHPAVGRAAVEGVPDATRGAAIAARVWLRQGIRPSTELALELQQHVLRELSSFKCPRRIDFVVGA